MGSGILLFQAIHLFEDCIQAGPNTFGLRVPQFWQKKILVLQYMKKLRCSPLEHFLVIRVCQKCQKCKNREKPDFWGNCGYISKKVRSIFVIFVDHKQKKRQKKFQIFFPFLRKHQLCKNWNFSKTRFFIFLKFKT